MSKTETIITPKVALRYPWLNKPDTKFDEEGVYKTEFLLDPNDPDHAAFIALLEETYANHVESTRKELKKPKMKAAASPVRDDVDDDGEETGLKVVRCKEAAKWKSGDSRAPRIVDSKNQKVDTSLFGGDIVRLQLGIYPWAINSTGIGVSLQPNAVQLVKKNKSGSAGDGGFDEI